MDEYTNGWTFRTLRDYLTAIIDERDRRYEQRFHAQQAAVDKAEFAADQRLDAMNRFREAMQDQQKTFLTKSEYQSQHQALVDLIGQTRDALPSYLLRAEADERWKSVDTQLANLVAAHEQEIGKTKFSQYAITVGISLVTVMASTAYVILVVLHK